VVVDLAVHSQGDQAVLHRSATSQCCQSLPLTAHSLSLRTRSTTPSDVAAVFSCVHSVQARAAVGLNFTSEKSGWAPDSGSAGPVSLNRNPFSAIDFSADFSLEDCRYSQWAHR
jgi:hypothetical protein